MAKSKHDLKENWKYGINLTPDGPYHHCHDIHVDKNLKASNYVIQIRTSFSTSLPLR